MANIYAYFNDEGVYEKIPRFSQYTQSQIEQLIEYCGLSLIKFEEVDEGVNIYLKYPILYLDFLNELNNLLSEVDDMVIKLDKEGAVINCTYEKKTIQILNENKYNDLKKSLKEDD